MDDLHNKIDEINDDDKNDENKVRAVCRGFLDGIQNSRKILRSNINAAQTDRYKFNKLKHYITNIFTYIRMWDASNSLLESVPLHEQRNLEHNIESNESDDMIDEFIDMSVVDGCAIIQLILD